MALNLASPGIVVREVDLTIGRVDATSGSIGGLVAPIVKGPVGEPVLITDESDLLDNFGCNDRNFRFLSFSIDAPRLR